jgi:hypothetical protein
MMRPVAGRELWKSFAGVQAIGAALATFVIIKNWLWFDLPQISTGGGNAFYLGSHTLTGGYEPSYGGLHFDVGSVAPGERLSVQADRMLQSVGWEMLLANPLAQTLANYWQKMWAFLFYPNVLLDDSLFTSRSLRICLVAGAGVAMVRGWRSPALLLAAAVAICQVLVHTPLLYNPRYSESALDLWLALIAVCGFAMVSQWSARNVLLFSVGVLAACYAGKTIRHLEGRVAPLHFNASVPHTVVWQQQGVRGASLSGFVVDDSGVLTATDQRPSILLRLPDVDGVTGSAKYSRRNLFLILEAWTPPSGKRCDKGRIDFRPDDVTGVDAAQDAYYPFRMKQDFDAQTFSFGVSTLTPTWRKPINGPGTFKIEFSCDPGGVVRLERLAIAESTYAAVYARKASALSSAPTVPVIEYYNKSRDHYFITWVADEIAELDASASGWKRTGRSFNAYAAAQDDASPVCRFYVPPALGDSHFFGAGYAECAATEQRNPRFVLESPSFMYVYLPLRGACPAETVPVFRLCNNRRDANQRHVTDEAIRDEMVAKGWVLQGEAPGHVVMCAPR